MDSTHTEATGIQQLYNCDRIDGEMLEVFVVCGKCPAHRVCKKQSNIVAMCQSCQNKSDLDKRVMERCETN